MSNFFDNKKADFSKDKISSFAFKAKRNRLKSKGLFSKNSAFKEFLSKYSKGIRIAFAILLFYNLQFIVNQHIKIDNYLPNFNFMLIAACTVYMDSGMTFIVSAMLGVMIESTYKSVALIDLLAYPTISLILAQFFGNKYARIKKEKLFSDRESIRVNIDKEKKYYKQIKALGGDNSRISQSGEVLSGILSNIKKIVLSIIKGFSTNYILNTVILHFLYELILIIYILLNGSTLKWFHIQRMLGSVFYTAVLALLLLPLIKKILGINIKNYDD